MQTIRNWEFRHVVLDALAQAATKLRAGSSSWQNLKSFSRSTRGVRNTIQGLAESLRHQYRVIDSDSHWM
jgi:hypothetical protein